LRVCVNEEPKYLTVFGFFMGYILNLEVMY